MAPNSAYPIICIVEVSEIMENPQGRAGPRLRTLDKKVLSISTPAIRDLFWLGEVAILLAD